MVNNFTNINKTNNHLSPQAIKYGEKNMTNDDENPGPGLGKARKCGSVKQVNAIPIVPFWYLDLKQQHRCKQKWKYLHRFIF